MTHDPGGKSKPKWPAGSVVTAQFHGPDDCYRTELAEIWDESRRPVGWLLMNPSVAGIEHADPTLIRTGNFSRKWGFGGQIIGNVHDYRITDSKLLASIQAPCSIYNDGALDRMAEQAAFVVLAFGLPPEPLRARAARVVTRLANNRHDLRYLALTADGTPRHPLYLKRDVKPEPWPPGRKIIGEFRSW